MTVTYGPVSKATGPLKNPPERWVVSLAVNRAMAELIEEDQKYAAHGKAEVLVDHLSTLFDVPMSILWGLPSPSGNILLPEMPLGTRTGGLSLASNPDSMLLNVVGSNLIDTAAHEAGHLLEFAGRVRNVSVDNGSKATSCGAVARLFGSQAGRLDRQGQIPALIALELYNDWKD